jgi:diacylglycerol kinase family enzyme
VTKIDVLRVSTALSESYMITNGGLGIPAKTAGRFNQLRKSIRNSKSPLIKSLGMFGIKAASTRIYEFLFLESLVGWNSKEWELEIKINDGEAFQTKAPFILINNQARLGKHFVPAPYTLNNDGTFDVTIIDQNQILKVLKTTRLIQKGLDPTSNCKHWEARKLVVKSLNPKTSLSFFGDGEILQSDIQEVSVECLPGQVEVYAGSLQ